MVAIFTKVLKSNVIRCHRRSQATPSPPQPRGCRDCVFGLCAGQEGRASARPRAAPCRPVAAEACEARRGSACRGGPRLAEVPAALHKQAPVHGKPPRAARVESASSCLATAALEQHGEHARRVHVQHGRGMAGGGWRAHLRRLQHHRAQRGHVGHRPSSQLSTMMEVRSSLVHRCPSR